jgi:dTDP-4-amino-4,6-dideoxygalactose transaminase
MAATTGTTNLEPKAGSSSKPAGRHASPVVPFLDLTTQFSGIRDEVLAAVTRVLDSQQFILGSEVTALENELAAYFGVKHAIACASGSDALLLSLMALDLKPGDEVITVPFTFVATAACVARLKARTVFADILPGTYNIDPVSLEKAITPRTKAIIPVHLFGLAADMDAISRIAERRGIPVIEDAAQAIGCHYKGRSVGTLASMGCFSFFPSKNLGGAGDGGLITTDDTALADKLKVLRVHGSRKKYEHELVGVNSRLDALQAAILRVKLPHLNEWTAARQRNADQYRALFKEQGLDRLVSLPAAPTDGTHVYNQFVIRLPQRDHLREHLRNEGFPTEIYYPSPLHVQPMFADLGYKEGDFPQTESACREVLALPIFPELTKDQQRMVVAAIADFFRNQN